MLKNAIQKGVKNISVKKCDESVLKNFRVKKCKKNVLKILCYFMFNSQGTKVVRAPRNQMVRRRTIDFNLDYRPYSSS